MAKGKKVDISDYEYEQPIEKIIDGKPTDDIDFKNEKVHVRYLLPMMISNASMGGVDGRPAENFDFYEMYCIGEQLKEGGDSAILTEEKYNKLKERIKQISKVFTHKFGLMVKRVMEAEDVELEEKK